MRIFENTNFEFVETRKKAYILSAVLLLISLVSLATRGLELGIDFRGGMEFVLESEADLDVAEVRGVLASALGQEPEVKTFGENQLLVRTAATGEINQVQQAIVSALSTTFPQAQPQVVKTDIVGPRFAEDLKEGALYSVFGSLLVIFIYVLIRFEWRFGIGAVAALFHDVTITLGLFSLLHGVMPFSLQIDQTIIAAFLTLVGYSLNDTVVIFDRIREYTNIFRAEDYKSLVNRSINTTLSRTVITSGTTLLTVLVLFIFGGEVLRGFSFALLFGIVVGTYSTVYVASPIVIELRERAARRAQ